MKIVIFNAPPRAGKDTAARGVLAAFENLTASSVYQPYVVREHKMSEPIKAGIHALFGVDLSAEYLEDNKDEVLPEFLGHTPRQAYDAVSEKFIKPEYGRAAFGHIFVNRLRQHERLAITATGQEYLCLVSDLGFVEELQPIIDEYGAKNILLIHIERDGCRFGHYLDKRTLIEHHAVRSTTITNDSDATALQQKAYRYVNAWLKTVSDLYADAPTNSSPCLAQV